jgi:hypothetical protein
MDNVATDGLPPSSSAAATCAWCLRAFDTIVELLDHVDATHLDVEAVLVRQAA